MEVLMSEDAKEQQMHTLREVGKNMLPQNVILLCLNMVDR